MTDIIVAVLALVGTLIGSLAGILTANKLTNFRIESLEKKVEKHNEVIERVTLIEHDSATQWKRLDELHEDLKTIKKQVFGGLT